jgi:hypothetical protein
MKVKCVETKRPNKNNKYSSITKGKEYLVLSIEFYDNSISFFSKSIGDFVLYRLEDDDGVVIPYPSSIFEIVSNKISYCWVPYREANDSYSLIPLQWAYRSFWDDFYNDEPRALNLLQNAKIMMYLEEK